MALSPRWDPRNLTKHHRKRITEDAGCFEDLLGIAGRTMRESEYELRSFDVVGRAWAEYEGRKKIGPNDYEEVRAYFVDDELVLAITDIFRRELVSCYHVHLKKRLHVSRASMPSIGQRRLEYRRRLDADEQGKMIINLKIKRIQGGR